MKPLLLLSRTAVLALLLPLAARAQSVGIGTTTPDVSAALDVVSTTKGLLVPRVTSAAALASPAPGLLVYQTGAPAGFYYNAGTAATPSWQQLVTAASGSFVQNTTTQQAGSNFNISGGGTVAGTLTAASAVLGTATVTGALTGSGASIVGVGVGIRADGGLNLGQNGTGNNILLGYQAGQVLTTGSNNVFSGYKAGNANTTGSNNLFSGYQSGLANTIGIYNLFSGTNSGYYNTTGNYNLFSGVNSGYSNTTGSNNLFTGTQSGYNNTTGSNNLFSGSASGYSNTTSSNNLFIGFQSGYSNTGNYNLFSGTNSGFSNTTGFNNSFSGNLSGYYNTTGYNNTALGYNSGPTSSSGAIINATAVGANVGLTQSNTLILGNGVNVGIGTSSPAQRLDVSGNVNVGGTLSVGVAATPGQVLTPTTTTHNMLAVAYGQVGNSPLATYSTSGNYTVTRSGTGVYVITFPASSGLSGVNFDNNPVMVTVYGGTLGIATFTGGTGIIYVYTFNLSGTATDHIFNFVAYAP